MASSKNTTKQNLQKQSPNKSKTHYSNTQKHKKLESTKEIIYGKQQKFKNLSEANAFIKQYINQILPNYSKIQVIKFTTVNGETKIDEKIHQHPQTRYFYGRNNKKACIFTQPEKTPWDLKDVFNEIQEEIYLLQAKETKKIQQKDWAKAANYNAMQKGLQILKKTLNKKIREQMKTVKMVEVE